MTLLNSLGYRQIKCGSASGSRRKFIHDTMPRLTLHQPHPGNILKQYQLEDIVRKLEKRKIL